MNKNRVFLLISCLNVLGLFYYLLLKFLWNYFEFLLLQFVSLTICLLLVRFVDKNEMSKPKLSITDNLFAFRCLFSEGGKQ
ncbi:MAG: hypothetical protein AABW52_03610 [Nanoarchaeota archaeon]